jgi:NADPH:quinone reductase
VVGFAADEIPTVRVNRLLLSSTEVIGVAWGAAQGNEPELVAWGADGLAALVAAGSARPEIGATYLIETVPDALAELARGEAVAAGFQVGL